MRTAPTKSEKDAQFQHPAASLTPVKPTYQTSKEEKFDQKQAKKQLKEGQQEQKDERKFADFKAKHPYMSEEELDTHNKRKVAEPIFKTQEEEDEWKW